MVVDLQTLWASPDQAGALKKHTHGGVSRWQERFFVLKGSFLFYFKKRHNVRGFHGVIPLEKARIQAEAPPGVSKQYSNLCITITLNVEHAYIAKHPFYVLQAPSPEVHAAWLTALEQASIPRAALIAHLDQAGGMEGLVQECADQVVRCFPTEGASVLSSAGKVRLREPASPRPGTLPQEETQASVGAAATPKSGGSLVAKEEPNKKPADGTTLISSAGKPSPKPASGLVKAVSSPVPGHTNLGAAAAGAPVGAVDITPTATFQASSVDAPFWRNNPAASITSDNDTLNVLKNSNKVGSPGKQQTTGSPTVSITVATA